MISKDFLALLARNIVIGKGGPEDRSFGGISVIMLGDFHQFSPVGETSPWRTLLVLSCWFFERQFNLSIGRDSGDIWWIHHRCWAEGTEENIWSCMAWIPATSSTRYSVNAEHLKMLRSLIIGNEEAHAIDFSSLPWSEAALVTPRHAIRTQWNDAAII